MFLETLDVKIIDLGTDVPAEKFIEAIENYNANISDDVFITHNYNV